MKNKTKFISLGFRHDYLNEHQLPNLNRFRDAGVKATRGMRPTFTTMTYPNHISIATGEEKNTPRKIKRSFSLFCKFRDVSRKSWNYS